IKFAIPATGKGRTHGKELKVLVEQLGPETKEGKNVLALKRQLKVGIFTCSLECENINENITSTKWKAIEKVKPKKKHKTIEKEEREKKLPEEDPVISITTSVNYALKISLPEIVLNTIPNLVYLDLQVRTWQPEANKKYQKPTFRTYNVTCKKVIWTTTDVNISDALKPLDRHISFWMTKSKTKCVLNVLPDQNIVTLYNEEKKFREGPYAYSNDTS
ncbi:17889_t:CDS:2, partial [Gigaspora margarita]